jgi:lysozyme
MTVRFDDKMPLPSEVDTTSQSHPTRRSVLTGITLMAATGVGGLLGFHKYGDDDPLAEYGGVAFHPRQGPEYDMTEVLPRDAVQSQKLSVLGNILFAKKQMFLSEAVQEAYTEQVRECGRTFNPEVHKHLTIVVARLNLYRADEILQAGQSVIFPPLKSFIEPLDNYRELAKPNSGVWISRVSQEAKEYAYLLARNEGISIPASTGFVHVVEKNADWQRLVRATYPELDQYPKTRAHLIETIATAHGASSESAPEEGRMLFLPQLKLLLGGQSDPKSLLKKTPGELIKSLPPALAQHIALEAAVWRKYLSVGTNADSESKTENDVKPSTKPESRPEFEDAKLPRRHENRRSEFLATRKLEISEAGLSLIKHYESFFAKPYYCCANKLTVGFGCRLNEAIKLARAQAGGLTHADADRFLKKDIDLHEALVRKHFAKIPLTQGMYDALVSWSFNTGALQTFESNGKKQPTLHKLLEAGDYKNGLKELLKWVYYTKGGEKRVARGLARRRASEYQLAIKGFKESEVPQTRPIQLSQLGNPQEFGRK